MSGSSTVAKAIAVVAVPVIAAVAYARLLRPKQLRWGSDDSEVFADLPGDDFVQHPKMHSTRAVTIHATPDEVWPWLVQMGYGRAGFYSFDQSEKAAHDPDPERSRRILPEFQQLSVGDVIPWGEKNDGIPVRMLEAGSVLSLGGTMDASTGKFVGATAMRPDDPIDVSWTFVLRPVGETSTRLITRTRVAYSSPMIGAAVRGFVEPGQYLMERKLLLGIKERAEAKSRAEAGSSSPMI